MSGRQSQAVALALKLVRDRSYSVTAAAERHKVAPSSVRRALRAAGVPKMPGGRPAKLKTNRAKLPTKG